MTIKDLENGIEVAASAAETVAPIVGIFNPGMGEAIALLTPVAATFLVKGAELVVTFRQDMTPEQMIAALELSKSKNWPEVGSVELAVGSAEATHG